MTKPTRSAATCVLVLLTTLSALERLSPSWVRPSRRLCRQAHLTVIMRGLMYARNGEQFSGLIQNQLPRDFFAFAAAWDYLG
ncbi:hypothetical protein [Cupriavidus sp. CP313]